MNLKFDFKTSNITIGVLRLFWASFIVVMFFVNHHELKNDIFIISYIIVPLFILNNVLYMILNSVRNFKNEKIGFKPMYIIFVIIKITSLFGWKYTLANYGAFMLILLFANSVIGWYLAVNDFIQFWIKKPLIKE